MVRAGMGGHEVERGHFCIGDLDSLGILPARQLGFDLEPREVCSD